MNIMSDNIQNTKNENEKSDKINQIIINISQSTFDSSSSKLSLVTIIFLK